MINVEIMSVSEFADMMIECRKDYILSESSNRDMIDMYNNHIKMVRAYTNSAISKKRAGLYKECKLELNKALKEIEVMEKSIREMDSTTIESAISILHKVVNHALLFVVLQGLNNLLIRNTDNDYLGLVKPIVKFNTIINIATTTAGVAIDAIKSVKEVRRELKKGADMKNALNQYRNNILTSCNKTKKFIQTEIKYVSTIIESDERYNK